MDGIQISSEMLTCQVRLKCIIISSILLCMILYFPLLCYVWCHTKAYSIIILYTSHNTNTIYYPRVLSKRIHVGFSRSPGLVSLSTSLRFDIQRTPFITGLFSNGNILNAHAIIGNEYSKLTFLKRGENSNVIMFLLTTYITIGLTSFRSPPTFNNNNDNNNNNNYYYYYTNIYIGQKLQQKYCLSCCKENSDPLILSRPPFY